MSQKCLQPLNLGKKLKYKDRYGSEL